MIKQLFTLILISFAFGACFVGLYRADEYHTVNATNTTEPTASVERPEAPSESPQDEESVQENTNLYENKNASEAKYEPVSPIETVNSEEIEEIAPEQTESIEPEPIEQTIISQEETHVETVTEEIARRGNIGRLVIPSVGVNVAVFEVSLYDEYNQAIVDGLDSAAHMSDSINHYGFIIVGDHVYQGFSAIKNSVVGSTTMYINKGTHQENYICTDIFIGYNGYGGKSGMFDINGNDVAGRNDGGLCLYTCNADGTITITFWQLM